MRDAGTLSHGDRDALTLDVLLWLRRREAEAQAQATGGRVIKLPNGTPAPNPWHSIAERAEKEMKSYLDAFGLTPKARNKITADAPDAADALTDFLKGVRVSIPPDLLLTASDRQAVKER